MRIPIDELLAPNYVNLAMGDADLAAFKAMVPAMSSVMKDVLIDDLELAAEGDAVFARFNYSFILPTGARRHAEVARSIRALIECGPAQRTRQITAGRGF